MPNSAKTNYRNNYLMPIILMGIIYFSLGFITWVNSTLIPYLQSACELSPSQAILVTFASYIAYAVMAFPSSRVMKVTGFKKGMIIALLIMAIGALIFIPAAYTRAYWIFLTGIFVIGIGMALLQTAINPYVTILGPIESAAKRISIMGVCNKAAGALAPAIMGTILLNGMDKYTSDKLKLLDPGVKENLLNQLSGRIVLPYIVIAIAFTLVAVFIHFSALPDIKNEEETNPDHEVKDRPSIFSYPYLWLGFITIFLYVGVEVMAGDSIQLYGHSGLHIPIETVKHFTSYTMIGMLVGYLTGIALMPKIISQSTALKIAAVLGIIFSIGVIFAPGEYSILFLALLGFANAPMWPAIWPLTIDGLGKYLKTGSALLVVGIAGGAIIPKIWASLGENASIGMQKAFWILIPCYAFILFFAIKGNKIGKDVKIK